VRASLIQVQVDVGEGEPGAIGLATGVDGLRRVHHRCGRHLGGNRHILTAGKCLESGLRRGVARVDRGAATLGPCEPLGVRPVFGRRDDSADVDLVGLLLLHDLP